MRTKARPVLVLNIASLTLDIWILSVNAVGEEGNHGKTSLFPLPQPVFLPHQVLLASSQVLCLFHPVDPVDPLDHIGRSNPATNPPYPPYTTPPPHLQAPRNPSRLHFTRTWCMVMASRTSAEPRVHDPRFRILDSASSNSTVKASRAKDRLERSQGKRTKFGLQLLTLYICIVCISYAKRPRTLPVRRLGRPTHTASS